ncbi:hypothetical protein SAMN02982994_1632 [Azospirillum lipoferum]|nr:hypothetical protein SAMN02982994_1632 [Azospirillum lipoferum]
MLAANDLLPPSRPPGSVVAPFAAKLLIGAGFTPTITDPAP